MKMPYQMTIKTDVLPGGIIEQTIDIVGALQHRVLNTAEAQTREALIKLGWTPPAAEQEDGQ